MDIYSNFEKVSTYENALAAFRLAGYNPQGLKKFYVFLDEFQRYQDLSVIIKNIYDHHKNIKLYVTGSSSLAIKHKIQESLAGRKIITHLYPLNFEEFLRFKGREELVQQVKNVPLLEGGNLFASTKELYKELEEFIKEAGIWNDVSGLNLTRLTKILEDEDLDNKIREGLLKFAEEVYKVDVRLVKKREPEK